MTPDWRAVERVLTPAIDRWGESSFSAVHDLVEGGQAHLWTNGDSHAVTELTRDLHIWLAGGNRAELLAMEASACDQARRWGCDRMTLIGRSGWDRVMAPLGYRPLKLLVKDL